MTFHTSIVIPAFNEALRLPETLSALTTLIKQDAFRPVTINDIIIVDDGSLDNTYDVAFSFTDKLNNLKVYRNTQNHGKGHAIRTGILMAESEWVLVADADMSTPWQEICKLANACVQKSAQIAIASRDIEGSDIMIRQSWVREHLGKMFNIMVRIVTGLPFKDTQCGFKFFKSDKVKIFFTKLTVDRFAWDVEFLMYALHYGLTITEVPVRWQHKEESRVHPVRDGLDMAWSVLCLRFRLLLEKG